MKNILRKRKYIYIFFFDPSLQIDWLGYISGNIKELRNILVRIYKLIYKGAQEYIFIFARFVNKYILFRILVL